MIMNQPFQLQRKGRMDTLITRGRSKSETFFSDSRDAETLLLRVGRLFGHHAVAFSKCSGSAPQAHKYNTEGI